MHLHGLSKTRDHLVGNMSRSACAGAQNAGFDESEVVDDMIDNVAAAVTCPHYA